MRAGVLVLAPALADLGLGFGEGVAFAAPDLADAVLEAAFLTGAWVADLAGALLFALTLDAAFFAGTLPLEALALVPLEVFAPVFADFFSGALGSATGGLGAPNFKRTGFSPQISSKL